MMYLSVTISTPIGNLAPLEFVAHLASSRKKAGEPVIGNSPSAAESEIPQIENNETLSLTKDEVRELWVDAMTGHQNPVKGMSMKFIVPKLINGEVKVEIDVEDIVSEVNFWVSSLVMYVMEGDLSMRVVKIFMTKSLNFVQLRDMYYHGED